MNIDKRNYLLYCLLGNWAGMFANRANNSPVLSIVVVRVNYSDRLLGTQLFYPLLYLNPYSRHRDPPCPGKKPPNSPKKRRPCPEVVLLELESKFSRLYTTKIKPVKIPSLSPKNDLNR